MKLILTICLCLLAGGVMAGSEAENVDDTTAPNNWTNEGGATKIASVTDATDANYVWSTTTNQEQALTVSNPAFISVYGRVDSVLVALRHLESTNSAYSLTLTDGVETSTVTGISPTANETWENYTVKFLGLGGIDGWLSSNADDAKLTFKFTSGGFIGITKVTSVTFYYTDWIDLTSWWDTLATTGDINGDSLPADPGTGADLIVVLSVNEHSAGDHILTGVSMGGQSFTKVVDTAIEPASSDNVICGFYLDSAGIANATNSYIKFAGSTSSNVWAYAMKSYTAIDQTGLPDGWCQKGVDLPSLDQVMTESYTIALGTRSDSAIIASGSADRISFAVMAFQISTGDGDDDSARVVVWSGGSPGSGDWTWSNGLTERLDEYWGSTVGWAISDGVFGITVTSTSGQVIIVQ